MVVAINIGEEAATVAEWVRARRVSSTILLDATGAVARAYDVEFTPTVFLVARDGTLVGKAIGTRAWTGAKGRELIRALLAP